MFEIKGKYTTALVTIDEIEEACINQLYNMVNHPAFTNPIVIMPDTHAGKGSVVGFTMPLGEKVIPNTIGVDIGCGMIAVPFQINEEVDKKLLKKYDRAIKQAIPTGMNTHHECKLSNTEWDGMFNVATLKAQKFISKYNEKFGTDFKAIKFDREWYDEKVKRIGIDPARANNSIGTLGGGNHFIEIGKATCDDNLDKDFGYYLTIHTGSRKFGECICRYHQNVAKNNLQSKRNVELRQMIEAEKAKGTKNLDKKIKEFRKERGLDADIDLKGVEYLEGQDAINYLLDMLFAQTYAEYNRIKIATLIFDKLKIKFDNWVASTHNYIDFEDLVIRKGAIKSYSDSLSVIPFNMEDGLLITQGKDNPDWNYSAPHGAGRLMSRGKAKSMLDLDEAKKGMEEAGVYTSSLNKSSLDEAKGAYKSSKMIEEAIEPTAKIIFRVKPILNVKDCSGGLTWKERREAEKKRKKRVGKEVNDLAYKKMKK